MNGLGIFTGLDLRNQTLDFMSANFGKTGAYYYWISRAVDERPVRANRIRKSVGAENTGRVVLRHHEWNHAAAGRAKQRSRAPATK